MEPGPYKVIETVAAWLVPPACREEVLGDLRERNPDSWRYLLEAAHIIPSVVYSRIRRTTDAVVALAEAVSMYTAFIMAALWLDRAVLFGGVGFLRLAISPAIFLVATILADVYSDPKRRWPLFGPMLGFALVYLAQSALAQSMLRQWALPESVFVWGSGISLMLISILRLLFPPVADRPLTSNAPAFWQKLEFAPLPLGLKGSLFPVALVVAVMVLRVLKLLLTK